MTREKDEAVLKTSERERELTELRREVGSVIEKKRRSETELERLRAHLLAVEEGYTSEAIASEDRERELRRKLASTEESLRVATAAQSNASQEATVKAESLRREVASLSEQRDSLLDKLSRVTADYQSQAVSLDNLTMALEGFQREKDNLLKLAERDYKERLERERAQQTALREEARALQDKVDAANEGLSAASRLGEQLEKKGQVIATLRQEVKLRDELLKKAQGELDSVANNNAGKVRTRRKFWRTVLRVKIATLQNMNHTKRDNEAHAWLQFAGKIFPSFSILAMKIYVSLAFFTGSTISIFYRDKNTYGMHWC